jgi:hypothetical protein
VLATEPLLVVAVPPFVSPLPAETTLPPVVFAEPLFVLALPELLFAEPPVVFAEPPDVLALPELVLAEPPVALPPVAIPPVVLPLLEPPVTFPELLEFTEPVPAPLVTLPPLFVLLFAVELDAPVELLLFDRLPVEFALPPAPPFAWLLLFAEFVEVFAPFDISFCGVLLFVVENVLPFEFAESPNWFELEVLVELFAVLVVVGLPTFCVDSEHDAAFWSHAPVSWLICACAVALKARTEIAAKIVLFISNPIA